MNCLNKYLRFCVGVLLTTHVTLIANFSHAAKKHKAVVAIGEGTSDGVGGNSINRKMLESYVYHPENSPAFTPQIAGIIKTIFEDPETKDNGLTIIKMKTWYVAPKKLKPIDKKILGIEFLFGGVEQVAIQNESEIWINSKIFNPMSLEEQSRLILHEVVMEYYLMQFVKLSDICRLMNRVSAVKVCGNTNPLITRDMIDQQMPPQPLRALDERDYQNIRFMTNWLLEQGDGLTAEAFRKVADLSGFDKRFSSNIDEGKATDSDVEKDKKIEELKRIKLSSDEFLLKLDSARYSNTLPKKCHSFDTHEVYDCEVTWEINEIAIDSPNVKNGQKFNFLTLKISESKTQKEIIRTSMFLSAEIELWNGNSLNSGYQQWYMYASIGTPELGQNFPFGMDKMKVGDQVITVDFAFDDKQKSVVKIGMLPYVLAGKLRIVRDKDESGKSIPKEECTSFEFVRYHGDSKFTEGVEMTESKEILQYVEFWESIGAGRTFSLKRDCHNVP